MKKAVIDIGTNSTLLLIAKKDHDKIKTIVDEAQTTRLGEGLSNSGKLSIDAIQRTIKTLRNYKDKCEELKVENIKIVGTDALRKASNANEFVAQLNKIFDQGVEIISQQKEALLTFAASKMDFGEDIIVIDIGGGSTEIVFKDHFIELSIGAVNLTEKFISSDPVKKQDAENLRKSIKAVILSSPTANEGSRLIATAGTATTLASIYLKMKKYDPQKVHGLKLTIDDIHEILGSLESKTIKERTSIIGLQPERADIIYAGAVLLIEIMKHFNYSSLTISDKGIRWSLMYEILNKI